MTRIPCSIIEDDPVSLAVITGLAERCQVLEIKSSFASPDEALQWLNENRVDLLFLDIEMADINGLQLLKALSYKPETIIISSNPNYAIEAFEFSVVDYLLKPIKDYSRFLQAVGKAQVKLRSKKENADESLFIRVDSILQKVNVDEIVWIEAWGDYIKMQVGQKNHVVYSTLKKIEEKLSDQRFVRVHRSFIVNINKITNLDQNNLQIESKIIPISSTYKESLLNRISIL